MSPGTRRAQAKPRRAPDGTLRCCQCDQPNDPPGSKAARCTEHKKIKKAEVEKQSKERGAQGAGLMRRLAAPTAHHFPDGAYSGPLGVAMLPGKAAAVRAEYGRLLSAFNAATSGDKQDPDRALAVLATVSAAVQRLNTELGPVLYGDQ